MHETLARAQEVFQQVFDDPGLALREETTADDIDGWDSLTHINLIIALEKAFGVKFATAEISKLKEDGQNVGSILGYIEKKLHRAG